MHVYTTGCFLSLPRYHRRRFYEKERNAFSVNFIQIITIPKKIQPNEWYFCHFVRCYSKPNPTLYSSVALVFCLLFFSFCFFSYYFINKCIFAVFYLSANLLFRVFTNLIVVPDRSSVKPIY